MFYYVYISFVFFKPRLNKVKVFFREREHFFKIFKIQVDDIILPLVADGVPKHWWVPIY